MTWSFQSVRLLVHLATPNDGPCALGGQKRTVFRDEEMGGADGSTVASQSRTLRADSAGKTGSAGKEIHLPETHPELETRL